MLQIGLVMLVMSFHFLGDFVFQTSWMASQKGRDLGALLVHIFEYTGVLAVCSLVGLAVFSPNYPALTALGWCAANGALHFVVDLISSRVSRFAGYDEDAQQNKVFWMTLGLDQLAHQVCLVLTLWAWVAP